MTPCISAMLCPYHQELYRYKLCLTPDASEERCKRILKDLKNIPVISGMPSYHSILLPGYSISTIHGEILRPPKVQDRRDLSFGIRVSFLLLTNLCNGCLDSNTHFTRPS